MISCIVRLQFSIHKREEHRLLVLKHFSHCNDFVDFQNKTGNLTQEMILLIRKSANLK